MLVFNQEKYKETGLFILKDPDSNNVFELDNVIEVKKFCEFYYQHRVNAIFAYFVQKKRKENNL